MLSVQGAVHSQFSPRLVQVFGHFFGYRNEFLERGAQVIDDLRVGTRTSVVGPGFAGKAQARGAFADQGVEPHHTDVVQQTRRVSRSKSDSDRVVPKLLGPQSTGAERLRMKLDSEDQHHSPMTLGVANSLDRLLDCAHG